MSGIQAKTVVKYALLPGIVPRLKGLFASGFGYIAFLMAQIYAMVRLLPAHHPYLNPKNVGHYGIRNVIAEAANALVLSKNNIDQLIIFVLMLVCIVLLAVQLAALGFSLLFGSAMATSMFVTANPNIDIAFMLLDQVFGAGNFFNSCVSTNVLCPNETVNPAYPWPFHTALQNMFRFYSLGILSIGSLIFLYFVIVVVVETATTGTPFGQRFQNVWVPIRLVVAIGLLIPLGFGYNSGQYITFAAAKYGSSLATNAWLRYNATVETNMGGTGNPLGERENLVAMPKPPDAAVMVEFMSLVHTCAFAYFAHNEKITKDGRNPGTNQAVQWPEEPGNIPAYQNYVNAIKPYFVKSPPGWQAAINANAILPLNGGTTYDDALDFYTGGDIIIRFGREGNIDADLSGTITEEERKRYGGEPGQVEATCGEIRIPVTDKRETTAALPPGGANPHSTHATDGYLGTVSVQRLYFNLIREIWFNRAQSQNYIDFAGRFVLLEAARNASSDPCQMGCRTPVNPNLPSGGCADNYSRGNKRECAISEISAAWKQNAINDLQTSINNGMAAIWTQYNANGTEFDMTDAIRDRGWGGAGIWFNMIAQVNGAFITSILNFPALDRYPAIMEEVRTLRKENDSSVAGVKQFNPNINMKSNKTIGLTSEEKPVASALSSVFVYWHGDNENQAKPDKALTSGALETGMNLVFGTYGLFAMTDENVNIHPLAQLVALGKGLVETSIRNIAGSTMSAAMGGLSRALDIQAGPLLGAASGFLMSTAFIGLTAGFVLYYVLPFLPFVYFYFAVASWIKTIFEAMVGVPLWALAHLRLDGDGLPGDSAANGYFLIFEIFIRPIMSIAGLIAAMIIFTAQVRVLNFTWALVTENVGGHNSDATIGIVGNINFKRSIVDEFFYTVIYAIIVYMLATASFKLIDKIPDNILRWMGQGVSSFGDINQDPTESLTKYAALGGMTAGQKITGGLKDFAGGIGGAVGDEVKGPPPKSDIRLKENIEHLGFENSIPIYAFSYIGKPERYKGVMAQDILKIKPEAVVTEEDGFMAVYYDMIGVEMEELETFFERKGKYDA